MAGAREGAARASKRFFADGGFFTPGPQGALRRARAAGAAEATLRRVPASAQHRPRARPVAHHDAHRPEPAAGAHLPEPFVEVHPLDASALLGRRRLCAGHRPQHGACMLKVVVSEGQQPRLAVRADPLERRDRLLGPGRRPGRAVHRPHSGQPEAKATPAAIAPVDFALSRLRADAPAVWRCRPAPGGRGSRSPTASACLLATNDGPIVLARLRATAAQARWASWPNMSTAARHLSGRGLRATASSRAALFLGAGRGRAAMGRRQALSRRQQRKMARRRIPEPAAGRLVYAEPSRWSAPASASGSTPSASAVNQRRDRTSSEIGKALRAGTNCGSCLPELKRIVVDERIAHARLRPARRAWSRWRGCRCSSRSPASAPWSPAAARRRPGRRSCLAAAGAEVEVYAPGAVRGAARGRGRAAASGFDAVNAIASSRAPGRPAISPAPRSRSGLSTDDGEAGAFRGGGARGRRAGQRDRQAGVLRFFLRRDRQPLAAGHRHLDRRRGAGVRAGDPRQARGADPARLRALGRRRRDAGAGRCRRSGLSFRGAAALLAACSPRRR